MKQTITYAPPNSIFFIEDSEGRAVAPEITNRIPRIWWSATSLIIGTLAFMDGDTTLTVSYAEDDAPRGSPVAEMAIECPSNELHVTTSHLDVLLRIEAISNPAQLAVWINRESEPDQIFVLVQ